jgi:hypothetical protein
MPNGGTQLGFDYLEALSKTGLGVAACPIGPAYLNAEPWSKVTQLFTPHPVAKDYVNIVVAPPNLFMGMRLRAVDVTPPSHLPFPGEEIAPAVPQRIDPSSEVIYEPQTALSGLYTIGVPNIAVTLAWPKPPEDHEIRALAQYDAVFAPTAEDALALRALGVLAMHIPPDTDQLARILSWLLP